MSYRRGIVLVVILLVVIAYLFYSAHQSHILCLANEDKIRDARFLLLTESPPSYGQRVFPISFLKQRHPHEFRHNFNDFYVLTFPRLVQYLKIKIRLEKWDKHKKNTPEFPPVDEDMEELRRKDAPANINYLRDLYTVWSTLGPEYQTPERKIVWFPHDRVERFGFPVLVKTRQILRSPSILESGKHLDLDLVTSGGSILFKLNCLRHYDSMYDPVVMNDIPFFSKKPIIVWRGMPTGFGFGNNIPYRSVSREELLERYASPSHPHSNYLDIGISAPEHHEIPLFFQEEKSYVKPYLSIQQQLQYRYILSVEGNDVATNLKWIMCSNSIVIAPLPQIESWFLESQLQPYVHFLPVKDDFSDLLEVFFWAESHPRECEKILTHAKQYTERLKDDDSEMKLQQKVLTYYLDEFRWV